MPGVPWGERPAAAEIAAPRQPSAITSGRAGSFTPGGTHATVSGASSQRSAISARCSLRKRAQSARSSSDTNSPGSRGSGEGGDPAILARSRTHSPTRCGNCGKPLRCGTAGVSAFKRRGDFTTLATLWDDPNGGRAEKSSQRARTSAAYSPSAARRPGLSMHLNLLDTEMGLRQRLAAACDAGPGDEPNA